VILASLPLYQGTTSVVPQMQQNKARLYSLRKNPWFGPFGGRRRFQPPHKAFRTTRASAPGLSSHKHIRVFPQPLQPLQLCFHRPRFKSAPHPKSHEFRHSSAIPQRPLKSQPLSQIRLPRPQQSATCNPSAFDFRPRAVICNLSPVICTCR